MRWSDTVIRPVEESDRSAVTRLAEVSGLFSADELADVEAMVDAFLGGALGEGHAWLIHDEDSPEGVAYFAPEEFSAGVWNLYMLAVAPESHGTGIGAKLVAHVTDAVREQGGRILLVETSGVPGFERTRRFYEMCGFVREATIRDYYGPGDDKVVFWKSLST